MTINKKQKWPFHPGGAIPITQGIQEFHIFFNLSKPEQCRRIFKKREQPDASLGNLSPKEYLAITQ